MTHATPGARGRVTLRSEMTPPRPRRRARPLLLLLALAGLAAGALWWTQRPSEMRLSTAVEPLEQGRFVREVTGTGVVEAIQERALGFSGPGTVAEVLVREGDAVEAGDLLARLSTSALEREIASVRAALTSASAEAERLAVQQSADRLELDIAEQQAQDALEQAQRAARDAREDAEAARALLAAGATSRDQLRAAETLLDQRERSLAQAENALQSAQGRRSSYDALASAALASASAQRQQLETNLANLEQRLAEALLLAPFGGVIAALNLKPGDQVATQPVMTLVDTSELRIRARFDENRAGDLEVGQSAVIVPDAAATERLAATLERLSPIAQREAGGSAQVSAVLSFNDEAAIGPAVARPGYTVTVRVRVRDIEGALLMPLEAITTRGEESFVVRIRPDPSSGDERLGSAERVRVEVLERNPTVAAVAGDLRPGDLIAVIDVDRLDEGSTVALNTPRARR